MYTISGGNTTNRNFAVWEAPAKDLFLQSFCKIQNSGWQTTCDASVPAHAEGAAAAAVGVGTAVLAGVAVARDAPPCAGAPAGLLSLGVGCASEGAADAYASAAHAAHADAAHADAPERGAPDARPPAPYSAYAHTPASRPAGLPPSRRAAHAGTTGSSCRSARCFSCRPRSAAMSACMLRRSSHRQACEWQTSAGPRITRRATPVRTCRRTLSRTLCPRAHRRIAVPFIRRRSVLLHGSCRLSTHRQWGIQDRTPCSRSIGQRSRRATKGRFTKTSVGAPQKIRPLKMRHHPLL